MRAVVKCLGFLDVVHLAGCTLLLPLASGVNFVERASPPCHHPALVISAGDIFQQGFPDVEEDQEKRVP